MPTVDRIITEAIVEDHASQALTNISRKIRDYIDEQRKGADGTARLSDAQRRQLNQLKSTERAFESLRRQIEPAYDQMKRLEQAQRTLDSALKQGLATEQQAVSILERYKAQLSGTSDALSKTASAYNQLRSQIDPTFAKTQQLAAAQKTLDAAVKAGIVTQQQATAQLKQYEAQLNRVNTGFLGLHNPIRQATTLLAQFGVVLSAGIAVQQYFQLSDGFTALSSRLKLVTADTVQYQSKLDSLLSVSNQYGQVLNATAALYTRMALSADTMNATQQEMLQITEAVAASFKIMGTSQAEAASATLQLSQAFGSGVLRGEEFNAVFEASPRIMLALADGLGVPIGALREMASQGQLTAEVVKNALISQLGALRAEAEQIKPTFGAAFQVIKNSAEVAVGAFNESTGAADAMIDSLLDLGKSLTSGAQWMREHGDAVVDTAKALGTLLIVRTLTPLVVGLTGAIIAGTAATSAWGTALAILGGPAGMLALIVTGLGFLVAKQYEASASMDMARLATDDLNRALAGVEPVAREAAGAMINQGNAALEAAEAVLKAAEAQAVYSRALGSDKTGYGEGLDTSAEVNARLIREEVERLRTTLSKAKLEWKDYGGAVAGGTKATAGGTEAANDLTITINKSQESVDALSGAQAGLGRAAKATASEIDKLAEAVAEFNTALTEEMEGLQRILDAYEQSEAAGRAMEEQIERENEVRQLGLDLTTDTAQAIIEELEQRDKLIDSIDDLKGGYTDAAKTAEQTAKQQADAYEQLGDSIQTNLSDAFYQVFSQGASSIKDLFNQIKSWFIRLLADLAAAALRQPIMLALGVSGPGALASGVANAATGGGGGGLFGNGAGLLGGGYGSILTGLGGILGAGSGFGLGLSAAGAAFTDFGLLGGIGASFGNGMSLLASGSVMAGIGATLAAAVPIIGAVLAIVSLFRKESVPKATGKIQLNPDDLGYDILQNSGKHGATPEPLMKALEAFQESYVETIDALDLGMEALVIEFHQRKDKFHALVGPIDDPTAFFTEDVDIEDQAAVADAINQTLLAALAQSDTSEASEALAAFLDSVTLDGIKNLEQGQAQQIIEWMLNLGDAADVAAGNLPYLADAIRGLGSQGVEIPELQTFTDSLIAIGVALDTTPFETYEEAVANSNKSMLTQLGEAQGDIMEMIAEFDGSADSTQLLAQSVLAYKDAATQAAAIIAQMQEAISSAVDSSVERIKLDTMSQEERYTYFLSQADAMKQALAEATDPEQIAQLFDQFQRYTEAAWQTLTDEQKQQQRDLFIDMLREGGDIANERLAAATEILSAQFEEMSNAVTLGMLDAFERAGLITEGAAAAFRQEIELSISTATDKLDELAMVMGAQFEAAGDMVGVAMVESSQDLLESLRGAGVNIADALGAAGLTVEEALGLGAVDLAALLTEAGIDVNKILADAGLESAKALEDSALIASGALVGAADRIDAAAATLDNISIDVSQSGQPPITIELDGQDLEDLLAGYPVHAASGYIGRPGSVGPDNIPIMVGRGEAVINRHQQSVIDQSLRQTHGAGIGALFGGAPKHTAPMRAERGFFQGFGTGGTIDDLPTLDDFMRELGRRLNQALGQGLFNQIDDLMAQHQDDLSIAEQIGADVEQVTAVFEAELAKLLESANLTADELALLSDRFPELADEASRLAQQLAAAAEAAREAAAAQLENDLSRRLNDLQGNGAINAMNDLLGWLNDTLASAEELGVSADLVQQVFGEELDALLAGLDISQLQALQAAFPDLADTIGDVVDQLIQAAAEASAELAAALENDLSRRLNELTGNGAINALNDLVAWLDETLASAEELGVSADLVNQVFGEELSALLAGLDMDQLEALLDAFPQFGDAIGDAINDLAEQLAAEAEAARQELEAARKALEDALSRELMSDVEGSLFDLIQWLQETAASAEELGADLGLVNDVFQQRFGGLLDSLSADQLELLIELLPQFEDALGDLYDGLLEAAEAAKITADAYAAMDALRLSVEAEKDRITAEYEAARQLAEQQYDAEIQRLQAAYDDRRAALLATQEQETERVSAGIDRVSESLRNLADLSAIIGNAIDRLTDDAGDLEIRGSRLRQAEAELAVMAMLSRNVLPDAADLERVINAVTADNAALFSTREDYLRSRGVAANQLGQIGGAVDARVGEQERLLAAMEQQLDDLNTLQDAQLAALEMEMEAQEQHYDELLTQLDDAYQNQIDALDKLVSDAEAQLNALLGINDGILSVTDAIIQMHQTLAALELHQTTDTPTAPPQLEPEYANGHDDLVRQVRSLRNEVSAQRAENAQLQMNIVKYSQQTAKSLSRWDVDGLPAERTV